MSSISERVARDHPTYALGIGRSGFCMGSGCEVKVNSLHEFVEHVTTVTEALTREQVAAEIEVMAGDLRMAAMYSVAMDATRIAKGGER